MFHETAWCIVRNFRFGGSALIFAESRFMRVYIFYEKKVL